jgi:hypothetical protein
MPIYFHRLENALKRANGMCFQLINIQLIALINDCLKFNMTLIFFIISEFMNNLEIVMQ